MKTNEIIARASERNDRHLLWGGSGANDVLIPVIFPRILAEVDRREKSRLTAPVSFLIFIEKGAVRD